MAKKAMVIPRYHCYACRETLQLNYTYQAYHSGMKERIVDIAMNNKFILVILQI